MTNIQFQSSAIDAGGCIGNAWELVKRNLGMYIGIGLITLILIGCIPIVNFFLMGPVLGGFCYVVLRDMRDEPVDFGMLFKGFEKFVPLMVVGLIQSIPGVIFQILQLTIDVARLINLPGGTTTGSSGSDFFQADSSGIATGLMILGIVVGIVFFVLMIFWTVAFQFAIPLVMERDLGVVDAIRLSAKAGFSNIGGIIVLYILCGLVGLLGFLALCLGYFVAVPVIYAAFAFAYRQVFPAIFEQQFNMAPPPPTAYGDFGTRPL